ncbi:MarR family transcriptional regulator [Amycolatopsis sp.]|uniref:MarR family winged helix-turn-helix transcriptional regulator n=1 Tax=Amycolatopsis sp. TaxID=37632 RepID=UPI002BB7CB31|nr:MarR family transcriptional regulator [Amycolatopsis sp.]HVV11944.1 MarR family transcriptional regulator [Amycolatopsis sp.]
MSTKLEGMADRDLAGAMALVHRESSALYSEIARRLGLTSQQTQLFCVLSREQPSFGELATMLGCDKTNVTGIVDRLVRRGYLARETDPQDRRVSRIVLTGEGEALRRRIRAEFADGVEERYAGLSTEDRALLVRLLGAAKP